MFSVVKKKHNKGLSYSVGLAGAGIFLAGLLGGHFLWNTSQMYEVTQKRADDPSLSFTNPLMSCGVSENKEFAEYKPLESKINNVLSKLDPQGENTVSVYYRDLITGRWFGINEEKEYSPASLLKVPIMIAYFKEAEADPSILLKKVYYGGNTSFSNSIEYYKSPNSIKAGNYYTIDELIASMIKYSDNSATVLLFNNINNNSLVEVMTDVGLKLPTEGGPSAGTDDYMTVKSYSYLFRLLYNSTYLDRDMSEKALKLLSQADFSQGITKGLPEGVRSAQKFGERTVLDDTGKVDSRELHDCGIVYQQASPYLLCIMTKGKDFNVLSSVISSISQVVYGSIEKKTN